jgi:hypothetical protein
MSDLGFGRRQLRLGRRRRNDGCDWHHRQLVQRERRVHAHEREYLQRIGHGIEQRIDRFDVRVRRGLHGLQHGLDRIQHGFDGRRSGFHDGFDRGRSGFDDGIHGGRNGFEHGLDGGQHRVFHGIDGWWRRLDEWLVGLDERDVRRKRLG